MGKAQRMTKQCTAVCLPPSLKERPLPLRFPGSPSQPHPSLCLLPQKSPLFVFWVYHPLALLYSFTTLTSLNKRYVIEFAVFVHLTHMGSHPVSLVIHFSHPHGCVHLWFIHFHTVLCSTVWLHYKSVIYASAYLGCNEGLELACCDILYMSPGANMSKNFSLVKSWEWHCWFIGYVHF